MDRSKSTLVPRPDWFNSKTKRDWDDVDLWGDGMKTDNPAQPVGRPVWMPTARTDPFDPDLLTQKETELVQQIECLPFDRFIKREILTFTLPPRVVKLYPRKNCQTSRQFSSRGRRSVHTQNQLFLPRRECRKRAKV
jgi:hypothetical protein